ncbi:MAG: hypothetical protein DRH03_02105 [Deltaproteobacteria bacterium]|nr:MAG: hypothetical protein DRH03_02105 [Deltaproteobacteria bacterium]
MVAKSINFVEFLTAAEDELLVNTLKPDNLKSLQTVAHEKLWQLLKEYFITGGMPQVIEEYLNIRSTPVEDPDSPPFNDQGSFEQYKSSYTNANCRELDRHD